MLRVSVDFGTSSTCTAVSIDERPPQVVVVDGAPLVPSSIYVTREGTVFVGHEADRQAAVDPARYEPHPKRRVDEGELLLGDTVLPVLGAFRAVISRAVREARRLAANAPADQLVLTHPADWGAARTGKLRNAAGGLATELILVPEPVAAAVFYSANQSAGQSVPIGAALAVLDLGGGTVDASVVRREAGTFRVLATRGDPSFGGADIDQAVLEHVGGQVSASDPDAWRHLVEGRELADRRRRRVLRQDVRGAKETLSRHTYADVPMPQPFPDAHVTRAGIERLIEAPMLRTVSLLADTIARAGLRPDRLAAVFLVGGSSRIPLVSRLLHERLGIVPVTLDQPETVVALGALRVVTEGAAPGRAGPGAAQPGSGPVPLPPHLPSSYLPSPSPSVPQPSLPIPSLPAPAVGAALPPPRPPAGPHLMPPPGPPMRRSAARRPARLPWLIAGTAVLAAAAITTAAVLLTDDSPPAGGSRIAQFHYEFTAPDGWEHSGGNPESRETDLRPAEEPQTADKILVKESELNYDATAQRDRAVSELRVQYERRQTASTPPAVGGFDENATFAGRDVLYYNERVQAATVDWYVVLQGRYQVSVGCQHGGTGAHRVRTACEQVVSSLTVHD
ncbi:MAG TPA: type VII secretion-associated protein [Pseudonocardiaceae bacterium]|nr:type VII secretion-associated protein [Pseudonocardiaceae bacterium]